MRWTSYVSNGVMLRTITRDRFELYTYLVDLEFRTVAFVYHLYRFRLFIQSYNGLHFQVLLQAETIRDLTTTSDKLSSLESEERSLRERAESAEAELVCTYHYKGYSMALSFFSVWVAAATCLEKLYHRTNIVNISYTGKLARQVGNGKVFVGVGQAWSREESQRIGWTGKWKFEHDIPELSL